MKGFSNKNSHVLAFVFGKVDYNKLEGIHKATVLRSTNETCSFLQRGFSKLFLENLRR